MGTRRPRKVLASLSFGRRRTDTLLAESWRSWLPQAALIAAVTLWIYEPALYGTFVWDDEWYITTNPLLHDPLGLWKFWFQPGSWVEYYPIEETVLWLQRQIFGDAMLGYHLTNVALHIVSSLLIWRLFAKLKLRLAWIGGLFFAIHPVQVESVAYISELKNTLSLPFGLFALGAWVDYNDSGKARDYRRALGFFLAAMLCKITLAPFPAFILLYAWWKRGCVTWKDAKASLPFVAVSISLACVAIEVGKQYEGAGPGASDVIVMGGFAQRLAGVGHILLFYVTRAVFPADYLPAYPKWPVRADALTGFLPIMGLVGAFVWFWLRRATWGRHAFLGAGFFVVFLLPFLGVIPISYMSFTWVMDHFLYLPILGLIGLLVAGLGQLEALFPAARSYVSGGVVVTASLMALESHAFATLYSNDATLWSYTLQRDPPKLARTQ